MGPQPTRERRLWWQVFGLLVLACTVWALALPPMTGPDEAANAVRASAVARGQWTGDPMPELMNGAPEWANVMVEVQVPQSFARADQVGGCFTGVPRELFFGAIPKPRGTECPELTDETDEVTTTTYEYRGQPFFYFLVGLPTLLSVDEPGAFGMRLVGLLLCSAVLASALLSVLRLGRRARTLVMAGALVALTPEVLYLASTQNAAGLEIAASLCLWATGLALVTLPEAPEARLVHRAGVALVLLVLTRGLSPAFAALALLVLVVVARPGRIRHLLGRNDVRAWAGVSAAAVAVSAVWLWYIHAVFPLHGYPPTGFARSWDRIPWWSQGMIAVFGSTDVIPPFALHWLWGGAAAAVLAVALVRGSRLHLLMAAGLVVLGVGLLISGEGFGVPQTGFWWQGRYVMPCIVGALLLAPAGIRAARSTGAGAEADVDGSDDGAAEAADIDVDDAGRRDPLVTVLGWGVVALFVGGQVWSFAYALRHYTVGHDGPRNPSRFLFDPIWSPPVHPAVLLAVFTAAVAGLALVAWRSATADGVPEPVTRESDAPVEYRRPGVMAGDRG